MENQQKQYYEEELEIDLMDYIRVVWRRKKSISAIFIVAIVVAIIISFTMPKTYQSSALLEVGKIRGNYLEDQKDVIKFVEQPATLQVLASKLGMPEEQWPALKGVIKLEAAEKFLKISAKANQPEKAKQIVEATINLVMERHQKMLTKEKEILQQEITEIQNDIEQTNSEIAELEKNVARLKYPKSEAEGLIAQSYIETLSLKKENLRNLKQNLLDKKRELVYGIQETKIESPALAPIQPISPNKKLNVIIAAVLGLFIGIFYAFVAEYWQKNKAKFIDL